ncbi:unnamed protein product [Camellia sinensis]|uniref:HORMA domain-containing protein n=1 Tax=Camellia sinensis TaxID=4442 RepID=A0A7J7H9B8_CAMSI|nr:hypothetical protein HYC85_015132 [Camellia sinensis]
MTVFKNIVTHTLILQPVDYEPQFFRSCSEQEAHNPWIKNPLEMEVGNVNSKHLVLALKVKSVLDPCEDENDDIQDDDQVRSSKNRYIGCSTCKASKLHVFLQILRVPKFGRETTCGRVESKF